MFSTTPGSGSQMVTVFQPRRSPLTIAAALAFATVFTFVAVLTSVAILTFAAVLTSVAVLTLVAAFTFVTASGVTPVVPLGDDANTTRTNFDARLRREFSWKWDGK
jgi:hypothetical protein